MLCIHGPKEEQPCVEVGPPWLNKVESESESESFICIWARLHYNKQAFIEALYNEHSVSM